MAVDLHHAIGYELNKFGGILRCEVCVRQHVMQDGDAAFYMKEGWPRCCGYTMRWWTQRQIDAGEVTP